MRWLAALFPLLLSAQITFTNPTPTAVIGTSTTIAITGGTAYFTFTGYGTCTGCNTAGATSVTYNAPSGKANLNTMLGVQVMPDDNIFNLDISNSSFPINSNSATWLTNSSSGNTGTSTATLSFQPSWGIGYCDSTTPTRTFFSTYGLHSTTVKWASGYNERRENGNMEANSTGDHHELCVDRSAGTFSETYKDTWNNTTFACANNASLTCNVSSAIFYPWSNYASLPDGGTTAAGTPLAPLSLHLSELKAGVINHAMEFTTAKGFIQGNPNTEYPHLWPATTSNGAVTTLSPIIGAWFRLRSSFSVSAVCTGGTTTANAYCTTILTALQHHGMMLVDIGTSNSIITATDLTEDSDAIAAMAMILGAGIRVDINGGVQNFDIVDVSALQPGGWLTSQGQQNSGTCNTQYAVCPNYYAVVAQSYATPTGQALITATPSSGSPITAYIAIQGAAIGSSVGPQVVLQSGSYSWQVPFWVNPSTLSQSITCTLGSGSAGNVTSGCLYTPPASGSGSAVIHAVAAADATATIDWYLTIIPSGTMRIAGGGFSSAPTDGYGNQWIITAKPEVGVNSGPQQQYPGYGTTPAQLGPVLGYYLYTYGSDVVFPFIVPNGNYQVLLYNHHPDNGGPRNQTWGANGGYQFNYTPAVVELNGTVEAHHWDWEQLNGYVADVPFASSVQSITLPVKVSNNQLYVAYRGMSYDVADAQGNTFSPPPDGSGVVHKTVGVDAIQVAADTTSSPHWAIDTQQQTTISSGQTLLPLYIIDWFTGQNNPTWSVTGAGASITSGGVVSLAAGTYLAGQSIVVTASNGTYSASCTLRTVGSKAVLQ